MPAAALRSLTVLTAPADSVGADMSDIKATDCASYEPLSGTRLWTMVGRKKPYVVNRFDGNQITIECGMRSVALSDGRCLPAEFIAIGRLIAPNVELVMLVTVDENGTPAIRHLSVAALDGGVVRGTELREIPLDHVLRDVMQQASGLFTRAGPRTLVYGVTGGAEENARRAALARGAKRMRVPSMRESPRPSLGERRKVLLKAGSLAAAARITRERWGCSRSTAYRWLKEADRATR